jgi:hypothetical protein
VKLFISWSGTVSQHVAKSLRDWIKLVVHGVQPWMSAGDLDPGKRWHDTLSTELLESRFGIFVVTRENAAAPWLLFEAGAISKALTPSRVVPLLVDVDESELPNPLSHFQSVRATREGLFRLVVTLHDTLAHNFEKSELERIFARMWPDLERELGERPDVSVMPRQSEREMLAEILSYVRTPGVVSSMDTVSTALRQLVEATAAELAMLEEHYKTIPTGTREADSFRAWSINPVRDQLGRIRSAERALRDSDTMSAAQVSVCWLSDVIDVVNRLREDLDVREYRLEQENGYGTELYRRVQRELADVAKLQSYLAANIAK